MISPGKVQDVRQRQKNKCNICGFDLRDGLFHLDHITPKSKGGDNGSKNLQIICISCHSKKNEKDGFYVRYPNYSSTSVCEQCGRVLGGFSQSHVDYLMKQHLLACPGNRSVE